MVLALCFDVKRRMNGYFLLHKEARSEWERAEATLKSRVDKELTRWAGYQYPVNLVATLHN